MDATFHVAVDVDRDLVRTTLTGFFDAAAMRRYLDARAAAFRQHVRNNRLVDLPLQ